MAMLGLRAAQGGLIRLPQKLGAGVAGPVELGAWWHDAVLPATSGALSQPGFHVVAGLLMRLGYAMVAPLLPLGRWARGCPAPPCSGS